MTKRPHIERIHIRGFRSLADVTFEPRPGANVLIGPNGSGKSNLMRFFEMLSWMLRSQRLADFVAIQGGADDQLYGGSATTSRMEAEIAIRTSAIRNDYRFALTHAHPDMLLFAEESFGRRIVAEGGDYRFVPTHTHPDTLLFAEEPFGKRIVAEGSDHGFVLTHPHPDRLLFAEESSGKHIVAGRNGYRFAQGHRSDSTREADWHFQGRYQEARIVEVAQSREYAQSPKTDRTVPRVITSFLRNCPVYQFHNTAATSNFQKLWDVEDHVQMRGDGGNLPAILFWLERVDLRRYKRICDRIQRVLPGFGGFRIEEQYGKVALRWQSKHSDKTYSAHLTSDGSLRFFALVTLLNLPDEMLPDVLLLDEPELGLHPLAITLVGGMIQALTDSKQVIVATQSSLLVDAFELDEVFVLEIQEGRTQLHRPPVDKLQIWLQKFTVGQLWQKNLLGGRP